MTSAAAAHKHRLSEFLEGIARANPGEIEEVLREHCTADCTWKFFHPFSAVEGPGAASTEFWSPLRHAFPDYEVRAGLLLSGRYEERDQVSMLGLVMGTHAAAWLGIPPTQQLAMLRFAVVATVRDGQLADVHVMFDLIDLMRQAGFYPLRAMPGSAEGWPFPPSAAAFASEDRVGFDGARTLAIIREMRVGLPAAGRVVDRASAAAAHSPHWAENMNWFGPAGIGSARGMRGFRDYHGALFLRAFPDRSGIERAETGPADRPGHFCEIGDADLAMTAGWPAMRGTHTGGQWLGLPPTGRAVEMRVADWYRLSADRKIADNWVMIDLPHILDQMSLDLLEDLSFFADPGKPRLD